MRLVALSYTLVAVGGGLGAMARYALNVWLQSDHEYPLGTLVANLLGCLLIGVAAQLVAYSDWFNSSGLIPDQYRLLFVVGFLGSFTTLSALVFEVNVLATRSEMLQAFGYLVVSVAGGFACFFMGLLATRSLLAN